MSPPSFTIWHVPLPVENLERSIEFYCGYLGFQLVGRDEQTDKLQAFIVTEPGGFSLELMQPIGEYASLPRRLPEHLAFECADIDAFRGSLIDGGMVDVAEVMEFDNGMRYLPLVDPDGLELEFFQGRAKYEASIRE